MQLMTQIQYTYNNQQNVLLLMLSTLLQHIVTIVSWLAVFFLFVSHTKLLFHAVHQHS